MKIGGVIAEYNPFHLGHEWQLRQMREAGVTHLVVAMSGNYVQRGEPAIYSKWVRARAAVESGADLVVELPTPHAMAPAVDFARAGVASLARLGVDELWFGSECGDLEALKETLELCIFAEQNEALQQTLAEGNGFPKARELVLQKLFGDDRLDILRGPNNLLGLEYLRAAQSSGTRMMCKTHTRQGAQHDGNPEGDFASASWIREQIRTNGLDAAKAYLPVRAYRLYHAEELAGSGPTDPKKLDLLLLGALSQTDEETLLSIAGVSEGLENRILKETAACQTLEECVTAISSRRYTKARIRRILMNLLLGIRAGQYPKTPQYLRILAMNERGMEILRHAKSLDTMPVLPKFSDLVKKGYSEAKLEVRATDLYGVMQPSPQPRGREFTEQVAVLHRD
jgi:predicted nucleotidyltransferase